MKHLNFLFLTTHRSILVLFLFSLSLIHSVQAQNNSLDFNAVNSNQRVTIPHHSAYNLGTGDFTVEAIVKIPSNQYTQIISTRNASVSDGFIFYNYNGQLLLQLNNTGGNHLSNTATFQDNQCHHLAGTRSGTTLTFYLDGVNIGTTTSSAPMNSTGPLYIGYDIADQINSPCSISEVRFWSVARTANEIANSYNTAVAHNSTGLIGLWLFNESSGQVVTDYSPTANHGFIGTTNTADTEDPSRITACANDEVITAITSSTASETMRVAPNPFTQSTIMSIDPSSIQGTWVEVYSMQGVLVYKTEAREKTELGNELPSGMYLVKLRGENTLQTIKITKE